MANVELDALELAHLIRAVDAEIERAENAMNIHSNPRAELIYIRSKLIFTARRSDSVV